jgi:hypothetical protein
MHMRKFILLLLTLALLVVLAIPTAHASHSFSVTEVQTCLDGATFIGESTAASSLELEMTGRVFVDGEIVAEGSTHTYRTVGETFTFTVPYSIGSFNIGDSVTISVSDSLVPSGSEGSSLSVTVTNCRLGSETAPTPIPTATPAPPTPVGTGRLQFRCTVEGCF